MCPYLATFALEMDASKFMPVNEIKPGMKGIGKTVFEGTRIDEFQIEVLYVSKNYAGRPSSHVIWALCAGGPLEETGVLSGMSGSPVYIDGRMIGAVAYRMSSFAKRPVAGITPIAEMLDILEKTEADMAHSTPDTRYEEAISSLLAYESGDNVEHENPEPSFYDNSTSMTPIQMPIMVSGLHPRTIAEMTPVFRKLGMIPVQGGGASSQDESEEAPLEPGSALCVQYVRGDASMAGSGTVTYVDGDRILGFGHPMSGIGATNLPMAGGHVGLLISSMMASSKFTVPTKTAGTLVYDDQYGIMGIVGRQPEFIPLKVRINSQEYNFEIAENKLFSPMSVFMTTLDSIYSTEKASGDFTMRTHSEIKLKGYPAISKDNIFSGTSPGVVAAAFTAPVAAIMLNRFEEVDVESLLLEISFQDKRANAAIDGVRINKTLVSPGDSIRVTVFLTPYMRETVIQQFDVAIPKDIPEGPTLLRISDAASSYAWERARAPMKVRATDLPHLVRLIQEEERNDDIIVELFAPNIGVTIGDQELPSLPLTTFSVMNSHKQTGGSSFTRGTTFSRQRIRADYAISGSAMIILDIDRDAP